MLPFNHFKNILSQYIHEKGLEELVYKWKEKHRFYHNTSHLTQIIQDIENNIYFKELNVYDKHVLLLAAFYHDVVYNPKLKNNEDKSKEVFINSLKIKDAKLIEKVTDLIETTKYRRRPIDKLERIFWDADNAGFKRGYNELLKNEKLLKKEYSFLTPEKYKESREKFLEKNLGLFGDDADKDIKKLIKYIKKQY